MSLLAAILSFIIWDVNPDIFVIPFINHPVRWYGMSWAVGFLISQQIMYHIYKVENRSRSEVDKLTIYMVIAAILGARLGHLLFYDPQLILENPINLIATWKGGMASHGAAIAVLITLFIFAKKTGVSYLWIVDRLVIVSAFTGGLVRLGNLMNSEMIGIPTDLPWAFVFVNVDNVPRHPAQIYESVYYFALFALLMRIWSTRRQTLPEGLISGLFLVLLFSLRFVVEFFKINQEPFEDNLLLNMGQILSIPFILIGFVLLVRAFRHPTKAQA